MSSETMAYQRTDQGTQFNSHVADLLQEIRISVILTSGYYPQVNGQVKWVNKELGWFFRTYCSREQHHLSELLTWAEYEQNSLTHSCINLTQFQYVLGYHPPVG